MKQKYTKQMIDAICYTCQQVGIHDDSDKPRYIPLTVVDVIRQLQSQVETAIGLFEFIEKYGDGNSAFLAKKSIEKIKGLGEQNESNDIN